MGVQIFRRSTSGWIALVAVLAGVSVALWRGERAGATPPPTAGAPAPGQVVQTPPKGATPAAVQAAPSAGVAVPPGYTAPSGITAPSGAIPPSTAPGAVVAPPVVQAPAVPVIPPTARIEFMTIPPTEAWVRWGKTRLGQIAPRRPLVVVRPRDSGPLDVVVTAQGFLPVHTRAHTFADTKVLVKLTPEDQKNTLLGYRTPLDAGVPVGGEGGSPSPIPMPAPQPVPPTAFDGNGMPRLP